MTKNKSFIFSKTTLEKFKSNGPVWERKFGGKIYTHYTSWGTSKVGAVNEAKRKRKNGNPARVIKLKDGYHVYVHL